MRQGFTLVELLVVIVIIAALAGLTAPQVIKMKKKGDLAEATNNAKQLGLAFMQFDTDIGGYPDDSTVEAITDITGEDSQYTLTGTYSNDYFRQFIAADIVESEQPFYAKTSYTKSKPDDVKFQNQDALKAGEVGFGYVMKDATTAISSGSSRPICVTPLQEGSTTGEMETDPFDKKAIVLFTDSSVRQLNIRKKDSKAILPGGNTLTQVGQDTIWGTSYSSEPKILAPEVK